MYTGTGTVPYKNTRTVNVYIVELKKFLRKTSVKQDIWSVQIINIISTVHLPIHPVALQQFFLCILKFYSGKWIPTIPSLAADAIWEKEY
jgi:hypothetical protein